MYSLRMCTHKINTKLNSFPCMYDEISKTTESKT